MKMATKKSSMNRNRAVCVLFWMAGFLLLISGVAQAVVNSPVPNGYLLGQDAQTSHIAPMEGETVGASYLYYTWDGEEYDPWKSFGFSDPDRIKRDLLDERIVNFFGNIEGKVDAVILRSKFQHKPAIDINRYVAKKVKTVILLLQLEGQIYGW